MSSRWREEGDERTGDGGSERVNKFNYHRREMDRRRVPFPSVPHRIKALGLKKEMTHRALRGPHRLPVFGAVLLPRRSADVNVSAANI